ncbi:hypothetical protein KSP40_PGU014246 [Platanthera guangdongensis]|uniref:Nitrate reductase n=1 Tax=Platanthera guangdongensis TaxID=2320717 RepID=A0ABR2MU63_9ASPA
MIIPGFIGGRMVKWLTKITVTATESESYYHYKDNRVFPSHVDAELADAEGGGKKVTRVEISLDGGETWSVCALNHSEKPNRYEKYWCWCFWCLHIDPLRLLAADEIIVRAWDQTLNTQPQNLIWNLTVTYIKLDLPHILNSPPHHSALPQGMMNNCWFRVRVTVRRPLAGDISIAFEHPTQPGNQPGGWMTPHKQLIQSGAPEKSVSGPPVGGIITSDALFSRDEVREHSSFDSVWIIVHDQVYDCTAFLKDHPGGADSILVNAGSDCSDDFDAIHSDKAKSMLAAYRIGRLKATSLAKSIEKIPVKLVAKTQITGDVRLFRFALPAVDQLLGLRPGHHIFLSATVNDKLCMRAYTPTSLEDAADYVELLIKIYDGGLMTQYLESLPLGAAMEINGPAGRIEYAGRGSFVIDGKTRRVTRVAMVAGGTGITPVYQIIRAMMREGDDLGIKMCLVYASRSEDDILMREDLDRWARQQPERLEVWYVVGEVRREEWGYSVGMVTDGVLREHIPMGVEEESLTLVCGPLAMVQLVVLPALEKMKYEVELKASDQVSRQSDGRKLLIYGSGFTTWRPTLAKYRVALCLQPMAASGEHFPLLHSTPPPTTHHPSSSSSDEDDENINNYRTLHDLSSELPELLAASHDPLDANTADRWIARHPSLIRLTGKHPFNSEPPLPLLMRHGFITPVPLHYVRNHGPVPGQTADLSTWTVEICGLVTRPAKFTVPDLARDFSSFQIPVTLVCAGNRRKEQNMVRQTVGFNWGPTSISTSVWRGVRLRDVLRRCGIMGRRHSALNVCFEGAEDLPGGGGGGVSKYGTSLRKEVAMDPSRDIMIAYMQNGELLTPDHGFPVSTPSNLNSQT